MRRMSYAEMPCPVARTLDVVGEWWSLLIVRDAVFGARRFEDFKASGIADNILSARLKRLVDEGIFERPYQDRPVRFEYLLTEKGRALSPVLLALRGWGQKWSKGDNFRKVRHRGHNHEVSVRVYCDDCGRPVSAHEVEPVLSTPLAAL